MTGLPRRIMRSFLDPSKLDLTNGAGDGPFIIGVAGGTASGKSSVCENIITLLEQQDAKTKRRVFSITQDSFYRVLKPDERDMAIKSEFNFDHPDAFDNHLIYETLLNIRENKAVRIPKYDFVTHSRMPDKWTMISSPDVVLFEGILVFYDRRVRDLMNMKLFVDTDADTRLSRRVVRDITERGRDLNSILHQYISFVKPAFEEFCLPTKKYADVIIPRGSENHVAIDLIVQHIFDILNPSPRRAMPSKAINGDGNGRQRYFSDSEQVQHSRSPH